NDFCLWSGSYNSLEHATHPNSGGWPNPPESTLFLRKLLENDPFKQAFIARMAELLNSTFANKQIGYKLSELFEYYNPEYSEHQDRWSPLAENETLEDNYVNVLEVVRVRACHMREHFINYFNLSNREFPYSCDSSALHLNQNDVPEAIDKLHLFPVPNNGTFTVVTPDSMVGRLKASLYDLSGKLVYSNWWQAQTSTEQVIYTKGLAAGIYTFQVRSESETHHSKVIIQ
ncbi:MAG: T9SS type A sorting domain-containing protein, partial [Flavobacteriales bacterium]